MTIVRPKVVVCLATYHGMCWLPEQIDSLLRQHEVDVHLYVSDDASVDGTVPWLQALAEQEKRVTLLPQAGPYGSAARNFYRLLFDVDFSDTDYVAFSDQDDIWYIDKLANAVALLRESEAVAVSSNVTAFWPDGRRSLVDKAQPQRMYDYLFEAAGPGCTYVMSVDFAKAVRNHLAALCAAGVALPSHHDWFCYALCRARNERWVIDALPSMDYRQHGSNEVGVNEGMRAGRMRLRKVVSGWYRREVLRLAHMSLSSRPDDRGLITLVRWLERGSFLDRIALACNVHHLRRRMRDRLILAMLFLSGLFFQNRD